MSESDQKALLKRSWVPFWLNRYPREYFPQDFMAGIIVTMMLIPQSMAYAIVAGLPPQYGMYASILPLIAYALLGTSMTMAVGPVAVTSLMTASALAPLAAAGTPEYIAGAAFLALFSGIILFACGALRLGFVAKLLSNPVISGFTSGSSFLILMGQIQPLLGITNEGGNALNVLFSSFEHISTLHWPTALMGVGTLVVLLLARAPTRHGLLMKLVPMVVMLLSISVAVAMDLHERFAVPVVGLIPGGLPSLGMPALSSVDPRALLLPAALIALVNFVSSISVAQTLALKRKQKISADAELRALGAAGVASALSSGFPISGGFARSLVNFSAGAQTPLAGIISAAMMALIVCFCTGLFKTLPVSVLAATIMVAVAPAIDFGALVRAWNYDRTDALALAGTAIGVITLGVEAGITIGVALSLASLVWRSSQPHIAVLGRVPLTEHFRNVLRYKTETLPQVLALRIDENLVFANAQSVDERIRDEVGQRPDLSEVLLVLSSVSQIDATALEMLLELNCDLEQQGMRLHLSEIKGPVLDRLRSSMLPEQLSGEIFLSTHQAFLAFAGRADDYSI